MGLISLPAHAPDIVPAVVAPRDTIAACLIVRDEQERLPAALRSLAFCDELIVVDSGSRDRTVEIATNAGARVVEHPWEGFGAQRNIAIDHATANWILEVDADERLTPELAEELLSFLRDPPEEMAIGVLPMREWFLGRLLGPSIKYPRYRTRLFRRGVYSHDEDRTVHEGIWPQGPTWVAKGDMHHVLAGSLREALVDWWRYARLESAQVAPLPSSSAYAGAIVVRPTAKLLYRVMFDGGWRDGVRGVFKILLDCTADSIVGLRRLLRRGDGTPAPASQDGQHFGRNEPRRGPVRLVALVGGATDTRRAVAWLARAREAGADVALVTDRPGEAREPWLFTMPVKRVGTFSVLRALDSVEQARPFDALVLDHGRPFRIARRLPGTRRGTAPLQRLDDEPGSVVANVTALARPGGPEPAPGVRT
jgi:hypothetical protein